MDLGKLNNENIVLVEFYQNDKSEYIPFEIQTRSPGSALYILEYSKEYQRFYYSLAGCGGDIGLQYPKAFYIKEEIIAECEGFEEFSAARLLDFPFSQEEWEKWLDTLVEDETVYCSECNDHLPTGSNYYPCQHVWWCNDCSWWSVPDERCEHQESDE